MQAFLDMKAHPDAPVALLALRQSGLRLAFLTNMTAAMVEAAVHNAKLEGVFERILSTDRVQAYKPDPRAYQMGVDAFGVARDANCLRRVRRLGRRRRQVVRLSDVLGEPGRRAPRAARDRAGRRRLRPRGPGELP
jgi:phosphoglycolate phosphatase-like HAD superfamily hydrolase